MSSFYTTEHCHKRKLKIVAVIIVCLLVIFTLSWFSGLTGKILTDIVLPCFLPIKAGKNVRFTSIRHGDNWQHCELSAVFYISPSRCTSILKSAVFWTRFLPPGTIRDGIIIEGEWKLPDSIGENNKILPFAIIITDKALTNPKLVARCTTQQFNNLLRNRYGEDTIRKQKKWLLGTYELAYKLTFESVRAITVPPAGDNLRERILNIDANGSVKFEIKDALLQASARAKVKKLTGKIIVNFTQDDKCLRISYNGVVDELTADIHNTAPWLDHKVSEDLRESLEKSLNKEKTKAKIASIPLPCWFPTDTEIDFVASETSP